MKTIVIYKSTSGFTKKYAEWISQDLRADIVKHSEINMKTLQNYDTIIFGGCLHAVGISGVNIIKRNLLKLKNKKIIVFATGASLTNEDLVNEVKDNNFNDEELKYIKFFYFRGGFDYNKLDLTNKIVMALFKLKILLKHKRTPDEEKMLAAFSKPLDATNKSYIKDLIAYVGR